MNVVQILFVVVGGLGLVAVYVWIVADWIKEIAADRAARRRDAAEKHRAEEPPNPGTSASTRNPWR